MFKWILATVLVNCSLNADAPIWNEPKHRIIARVCCIQSAIARIKTNVELGEPDEIKQDLEFIENHLLGRDIDCLPGY